MGVKQKKYTGNYPNTITDQRRKEELSHTAYKNLLGTAQAREHALDLDFLDIAQVDLSDQELIFSEEEVWAVIKEMPADCAPGPDGFFGLFYQKVWVIIKGDVMAAIHKLFLGNGRSFGRLNQALITLIRKKPDACTIADFHPFSWFHSVRKICAKLLATRLS